MTQTKLDVLLNLELVLEQYSMTVFTQMSMSIENL